MQHMITATLRHNESNIVAVVNHTVVGAYIVISNDKQKLFEYHKKNYDTSLLQYMIDHKLLNCITLN